MRGHSLIMHSYNNASINRAGLAGLRIPAHAMVFYGMACGMAWNGMELDGIRVKWYGLGMEG